MNQIPEDLKNYQPSLDMDATERAWASVAVIVLIFVLNVTGAL